VKTATLAQIGFIAIAAVAVYSFVGAARNDQRRTSCSSLCAINPAYAGRNRRAPDFELPDLDGKPVKLSQFRGKTVFLNFWTKTCGPCIEEMPSVAELAKIAKTRGDFVVVTVSTDESADDVRTTLKVVLNGEAPPFVALVDPEANVVHDTYGTRLFPETWVIDPDGIIRARYDGGRNWADSLAVDFATMVGRPGGCPVEFFKGAPRGEFADVCRDEG
jgi:thiol-disulfide isomerase/thioredoxin